SFTSRGILLIYKRDEIRHRRAGHRQNLGDALGRGPARLAVGRNPLALIKGCRVQPRLPRQARRRIPEGRSQAVDAAPNMIMRKHRIIITIRRIKRKRKKFLFFLLTLGPFWVSNRNINGTKREQKESARIKEHNQWLQNRNTPTASAASSRPTPSIRR